MGHHSREETVNTATHAVGLVCAVAGAVIVMKAAFAHGGSWEITGCLIYALTLVAVYAASTLSHAVSKPTLRHALRIADQAIIYLFIAGTFTPVAFAWLREGTSWLMIFIMWFVALVGFTRKAVFSDKVLPGTVSTALYLILGWMPVLIIWPLSQTAPIALTGWIISGGLCYTLGIIFFYYDKRVPYFHAVWHLMVMAGSLCHYLGILFFCTHATA